MCNKIWIGGDCYLEGDVIIVLMLDKGMIFFVE